MSVECENDTTARRRAPHENMLYGSGLTMPELVALQSAEHARTHNVVAVILDPNADPRHLRYYLLVARDVLEAEMRTIREGIVGAAHADSRVSLGIATRVYDEQQRSYNSATARTTAAAAAAAAEATAPSATRPRTSEETKVLDEVERMRAHVDMFEQLAEVACDTSQYHAQIAARVTFLTTLTTCSRLARLVLATNAEQRLAEHVPLPRANAEKLFPFLNHITEMHYMYQISGEQYLREAFCFQLMGMTLAQVVRLDPNFNPPVYGGGGGGGSSSNNEADKQSE